MRAVVRRTFASQSLLLTIAARELREFRRDGRLVASAVLIVLLLGASLVAGVLQVRSLRTQRLAAQAATYDQWLTQGERNAHSATHYGLYAVQPKSPLAVIDPGIDRFAGTTVFLEAHKRNELLLRSARDSADVARFADLSAAFLLHTLVPLWLLLLAHGAVAADRASGTLRFTASFPVSRRLIGLGKVAGVFAAASCVLVPAAALGAMALTLSGGAAGAAPMASRAALMGLAYIVYFIVILLIGIAICARLRSARLALVILLGLWIAACVVVPRAVSDYARARHPLPSALEFKHGVNRQLLEAENDRNRDLRDRMLHQHGVRQIEELPFNFEGLDLQDSEEYGNRVLDAAYRDLYQRLDAQDRKQHWAAWLSPLQPMRALSMALAGTDPRHHRHFSEAAEEFRRLMVRMMNMAVMRNAGTVNEGYIGTQALNRTVGREVWTEVPPFSYTPPSLKDVLRDNVVAIAALTAWLAAAALLASLALRHMEIEA